jgi:hypothetical protein
MMRKSIIGLAVALSLQLSFAQDFKRSYAISESRHIVIWNYRGSIKVTGYAGDSVEIVAKKKGPDRELIEIIDNSFGDRIDVHPRYLEFGRGNAMVDFEVRVPTKTDYNFDRVSSIGGNVEVSDIRGRLRAESRFGNVEVNDVRGLVSASSVSGNVSVNIDQASGRNNMRFSSISGNVMVRAPADLDALIDMSSMSGLLKTDFPIEIQEMRYGSGRSARGKLGTGSQLLHIRSVSGEVSLIRE